MSKQNRYFTPRNIFQIGGKHKFNLTGSQAGVSSRSNQEEIEEFADKLLTIIADDLGDHAVRPMFEFHYNHARSQGYKTEFLDTVARALKYGGTATVIMGSLLNDKLTKGQQAAMARKKARLDMVAKFIDEKRGLLHRIFGKPTLN
jgi:hypothetical protein